MKLIILSGDSGCGKTTSLNLLHDLLLQAGKVKELSRHPCGHPDANDYEYLLENQRGEKLVVSTWGDYHWLLKDCCQRNAQCDVIVCACNKNFMRNRVHTPFNDALLFDSMPTVVMKAQLPNAQNHASANRQCAQYLLELINLSVNVI